MSVTGTEPFSLPPPTELNDTHKKWGVFVFVIIFLVISTCIALLRLISRWRTGGFGMDDWVTIPALVAYIAHSIVAAYVNANAGLGKPLWEVTMPEFELWGKGHVATCFLYPITSGLIRISILLLYDRVFSKASPTMRILVRASIAFVGVYIAGVVIYSGFLCKPLHKFWKPFERAQYCGSNLSYWIYTAVVYGVSLFQDIWLLLLPIIPVMGLEMSLRKRVAVISIFALGSSACVAAAYKLAVFGLQWGRTGKIDPRWLNMQAAAVIPPQFDQYGYTMWIPTQAELSAAVIGSSLIPLRSHAWELARKIWSTVGSTWASGSGSGVSKGAKQPSMERKSPIRKGTHAYTNMSGDSMIAITTDVELASFDNSRR